MKFTNEISGTGRNGNNLTIRVGDKITAVALDGAAFDDVVRTCFMQHDSLGNVYPAVVLTTRSWSALGDIVSTKGGAL